jgi:mRNA interferase RelE/StbE
MTKGDPYQVGLSDRAKDAVKHLDPETARQIRDKLVRLADSATILRHEALKGRWKGYFRLRVGDYRVIYILDHKARSIDVAVIGHRREVYDE